MPIQDSTYKTPYFFKNGFVSTVYSGLFRNVDGVNHDRERMTLSDGDFLDLDWSYSKKSQVSFVFYFMVLKEMQNVHT